MSQQKSLTELIYSDLVGAVSSIAQTYTDRPTTTPQSMKSFLVVKLGSSLDGRVAGDMDVMADCYGIIDIYYKAKSDGTKNVHGQGQLELAVKKVFPIKGQYMTASKPRMLMKGNDGNGFQVTRFTYRIRTKFNANIQN